MVSDEVLPPGKCSRWNKEAWMEFGSWIRPSPHFGIVCAIQVITGITNCTSAHANAPEHEHYILGHLRNQGFSTAAAGTM